MAKQTIVKVTDDLDGSEGARTVKFALDGKNYEIDLSEKNEQGLRAALAKYIEAGTPVVSSNYSAAPQRRKYGTGPARKDTKNVREWLRRNGIDISDRGRIPKDQMAAFEQYGEGGLNIPEGHPLYVEPKKAPVLTEVKFTAPEEKKATTAKKTAAKPQAAKSA